MWIPLDRGKENFTWVWVGLMMRSGCARSSFTFLDVDERMNGTACVFLFLRSGQSRPSSPPHCMHPFWGPGIYVPYFVLYHLFSFTGFCVNYLSCCDSSLFCTHALSFLHFLPSLHLTAAITLGSQSFHREKGRVVLWRGSLRFSSSRSSACGGW